MSQFVFEAIGTHWQIDIFEDLSTEKEKEVLDLTLKRIKDFDLLYSRFRGDSWITQMSKVAGTYDLPPDAEPLFNLYRDVYKITQALVTPLVGQTLVDAGYDAEYSLKQSKLLVEPPLWEEVIFYHPPKITLHKPVLLDLGAAGKGYLVDIVSELIESLGINSYCVDAGGDMRHRSVNEEGIRVGFEDPRDTKKVIGVINLKNKALAGSAGNRRKWQRFNHIINPHTLTSPTNILAVWVVADTAMLADMMTTALYFAPSAELLESYTFEYLVMYEDASVEGNLIKNPMVELY